MSTAKENIPFFIKRAYLWLKILKTIRGLDVKSELNLLISSIIDIIQSIFFSPTNATLVFSGNYLLMPLGIMVRLRGGTDDLYNVIPGREGPVDEFIRSVLRPGDVFVDVGANIGYYTILGALRGCRVVAVEPIPETVAILRQNLELNGIQNVIIVDKCAWSEGVRLRFGIPKSSLFGLASAFRLEGPKSTVVEVECVRLDDILREYGEIKLVKIDVEGAEYEVLKGMEESLSRVNFLVLEISRKRKEILDLLLKYGFKIKKMGYTTYVLAYKGDSCPMER